MCFPFSFTGTYCGDAKYFFFCVKEKEKNKLVVFFLKVPFLYKMPFLTLSLSFSVWVPNEIKEKT
jgi:hypothetical protein